MLKTEIVALLLLFSFCTTITYSKDDLSFCSCEDEKTNQYIVCCGEQNSNENQAILNDIHTKIFDLKQSIALLDQEKSKQTNFLESLLTVPSFAIAGATLASTILAIIFVVFTYLGWKTKGELDKELENSKKDRDKHKDESENVHKKLMHEGNYLTFLLFTQMGYMSWKMLEGLMTISNISPENNKIQSAVSRDGKIFTDLMNGAINASKRGVNIIDFEEDKLSKAGLTDEEKKKVSIVHAKINLAFYYAFANRENDKEHALKLINDANAISSSLSHYDYVRENLLPMWILDSLFVKRKYSEANQKDSLKLSMEDFIINHPNLKETVEQYIKWTDGN